MRTDLALMAALNSIRLRRETFVHPDGGQKLNQTEAAHRFFGLTGTSARNTFAQWEKGEKPPSATQMKNWKAYLEAIYPVEAAEEAQNVWSKLFEEWFQAKVPDDMKLQFASMPIDAKDEGLLTSPRSESPTLGHGSHADPDESAEIKPSRETQEPPEKLAATTHSTDVIRPELDGAAGFANSGAGAEPNASTKTRRPKAKIIVGAIGLLILAYLLLTYDGRFWMSRLTPPELAELAEWFVPKAPFKTWGFAVVNEHDTHVQVAVRYREEHSGRWVTSGFISVAPKTRSRDLMRTSARVIWLHVGDANHNALTRRAEPSKNPKEGLYPEHSPQSRPINVDGKLVEFFRLEIPEESPGWLQEIHP